MERFLSAHDAGCDATTWLLLRTALAVETWRRWTRKRAGRLRASLRRLMHRFSGVPPVRFARKGRVPWNKTPDATEEKLVHLHVATPHLGAGQLQRLAERVLGFHTSRETVRQILLRRRKLVIELEQAKKKRPRRIEVAGARQLWGVDLTLVWLLGFWPVWILAAIDYHGSRVVAFERLRWPTAAEVVRALDAAFAREGAPARVLTDNGTVFTSGAMAELLAGHGIRHSRIRPGHAWTNGRVERLLRTFKETVASCIWLFATLRQVDRYCADFIVWYNRDRPHSAWDGRTPDEVYFGREKQLAPVERVAYFDGHLRWYRFG